MVKKPPNKKKSPALPKEVQSLINRKLRHLKREREAEWLQKKQSIFSSLGIEVREVIVAGKTGYALSKVPQNHYKALWEYITAATKAWPDQAWKAIAPIVESEMLTTDYRASLEQIIDEHSWAFGARPLTLEYANLDAYRALVAREGSRYGGDPEQALSSSAKELAAIGVAGEVATLNAARRGRESASIALQECLREITASAAQQVTKREYNKLLTEERREEWKKAHRKLKKSHPNKSLSDYARLIAKMDIAQKRTWQTIRRQLSEK